MKHLNRSGFTLVELLVVITIIGILIALLLPAVQSARESGRRTQCANNLRNLGTACLQHLEAQQHLPTGGWGENWVGLPGRGFGMNQPGGWIYNILPFIEQGNLHDLGMPGTGLPNETPDPKVGSAERIRTSLAFLYCPTRRRNTPYTAVADQARIPKETSTTPPITKVARCDYAINGGSVVAIDDTNGGPDDLATAESYNLWPDTTKCNGISYSRSEVKSAHIRDGLSNTYLAGEKYLDQNHYTTGQDEGDNATAYSGAENDLIRWVWNTPDDEPLPPQRDKAGQPGYDTSDPLSPHRFGSAHSAGWHAGLCDGSVRLLRYNLDPQVHYRLGVRNDGTPVDQSLLD